MRQLSLRIGISVVGLLLVGCADRCFYQAGKSIEQCQQDLLECAYSHGDVGVCMQARGYGYSDTTKLARNGTTKKVTVRFEEYEASGGHRVTSKTFWIMDGLSALSFRERVLAEQKVLMDNPNSPPRKLIGYKARKNDSGKFIFTPVYEDQRRQ